MKKHKLKNKEEKSYLKCKRIKYENHSFTEKRRRMADKSKYDKVGKVMGYTVKIKTVLKRVFKYITHKMGFYSFLN